MYDVAVIGAGVIGSAAACQIAKSGAKVILLEQVQYYFARCFNESHERDRVNEHVLPPLWGT